MVSMAAFGAALAYGGTLWNSTLQGNVPPNLIGRLSSFDWFGSTALRPVGLALVGPIAILIGNRADLYLMCGLGAVLTALALAPKEIQDMRSPQPAEAGGG